MLNLQAGWSAPDPALGTPHLIAMHHHPCWLDSATPFTPPDLPVPERTDVAVIGGGYTGICAARALAQQGVAVVLLERETLGWGASTRNGGFVLPGFKREVGSLLRRFGAEAARALYQASLASVRFLEDLIAAERIDCDYARAGHAILAWRPSHYAELERSADLLARQFGCESTLVPRERLHEEIDSSFYHGALVDPEAGGIQPARYCFGLAAAAARAGARLLEQVDVLAVRPAAGGYLLSTSRGPIRAEKVLVATNGYSGAAHPWSRRRIVPVGSYLIATAPLDPARLRSLIPRDRVLSDTKNHLYYFRTSPDHRLVFGGRASFVPTSIQASSRILERGMHQVFPGLRGTSIEYAWWGNVGMTVDQLPHAGVAEGIHYALGYCGHGVAMSSYLGDRIGRVMAGRGDLGPFAELRFPAIPFYSGRPWFLPAVGAWYRLLDRIG